MASFNAVCQQVPGELAPKLALAVACERGGRPEVAEGLYNTCAQTDATYVAPASFGMARVRAMRGDTAGAVSALDQVPSSSRGFVESRQVRADVLLSTGNAKDLVVLDQAMTSIESVSMDPTDEAPLHRADPPAGAGHRARRRRRVEAEGRVVRGHERYACAKGSSRPSVTSPATPTSSANGSSSSTRPTPYGAGR